MDREWMGNPVLASEGLHTGVHHRARLHGWSQTGVDKRHFKNNGLSVDPVSDHEKWAKDIQETQGHAPNYPLIGDSDLKVAKLYDMIHPNASGDAKGRTAQDNATVRAVFVVGPDK